MSVDALIRHFAEVDPAELDRWEVQIRREAEDPERSGELQQEARRRLLERIGEARRTYA